MTISITGASGAIGSRLSTHLAEQGHRVRALVRPGSTPKNLFHRNIEIMAGDVTVRDSLLPFVAGSKVVVHAAGLKRAAREQTLHRHNVLGTKVLCDACESEGVTHLIYVSSLAAQGPSKLNIPHTEAGSEAPCNAYGVSKLAAEKILMNHALAARTTVLRPGILYGPGTLNLLPWVRLIQLGMVPVIAKMELSLLYLDDLIRCLALQVTRAPSYGPHFLVSGPPVSMEHIVNTVEELLNHRAAMRVFTNRRILKLAIKPMTRLSRSLGLASGMAKAMTELSEEGWAVASGSQIWQPKEIVFTSPDVGIRTWLQWAQQTGYLSSR